MDAVLQVIWATIPNDCVYYRGTEEYQAVNWTCSAREDSPAIIIAPNSADIVSLFLRTIRPHVLAGVTTIGIRGMGSQRALGCANARNGVLVITRSLREIEFDIPTGIVSIGAGANWEDVHQLLASHSLAVASAKFGRLLGGASVASAALSGGLSMYSAREGLICDNVVAYEIVLASGEIVKCSAENEPDLFRALRGGGNNFGIVTTVDMRTFPQSCFRYTTVLYPYDSMPSQIDALVGCLNTTHNETDITMTMVCTFNTPTPRCRNQVCYISNLGSAPATDPLVDVQRTAFRASLLAYPQRTPVVITPHNRQNRRHTSANVTLKPHATTLIIVTRMFLPYSVSLLTKCLEAGGNATGLSPDDGPLISVDVVLRALHSYIDVIERVAMLNSQFVRYQDMHRAAEFQDPIHSYGSENRQFLQRVSQRYDPEGLFQQGVPGGSKLFRTRTAEE
ncbi:hypothetical protein F4802DRAFT_607546 [Xylaria palmicola]|nr:hypothetical protein F4802DRAFT_607546 [Xylaria palmicola]